MTAGEDEGMRQNQLTDNSLMDTAKKEKTTDP